ncbi:MAG: histidine kinase [Bacteroidia bacterium]|nr:histidine kinase [Bacteroidia bacterium]
MRNTKLSYMDAAKYATGIFILSVVIIWMMEYFGRAAFIPTKTPPRYDMDFNKWVPIIGLAGTYLYLFILFVLNFKILESKIQSNWKTPMAIGATIVVAFIFNSVMMLCIQATTVNVHMLDPHARIGTLVKDFVYAVIVLFSSQIAYLSSKKQQMILEYETMKAESARSRFEALKNQINPHFLFNTFNTLDSLIEEEPEKARNYLQRLSSVFRYVMPNKDVTTLEDELKFTRNYNELMQLRYEDSLVFEFNVNEKYLSYEIVPLSVQTLIENAIKHNVISSESPLVIHITVGSEPMVTVSNEIKSKKTSQVGSGIGLSNLTERFRLKFQKEIIISDTGGVFTVSLPLNQPMEKIS